MNANDKMRVRCIGLCLLSGLSSHAFGYVGPGVGVTMLGALWGVIVAVVLALGAVLYWPIKTLLRKRRKVATEDNSASADP